MTSVFDSESERRAFTTLRTRWAKYVDVYPQFPVRKVLGYDTIQNLPIRDKAKMYLQKTEFDFVIAHRSGSLILAVEFDGLGHGFSRDGQYVQLVKTDDPFRKLKLDCKLSACEACDIPLVIVSYSEIEPADDPDCPVTALDVIIGQVLAGQQLQDLVRVNSERLGVALEQDSTGEVASSVLSELEILAENENPIKIRIKQMQSELPVSFGLQFHPLRDRHNWIGARQSIHGGVRTSTVLSMQKVLLSYDAYVRTVNCSACDTFNVANILAEYGLARKALREIGKSKEAWDGLQEKTLWTKF